MGATYTRQSSYTDGDVITAAHTNDEFNQLLAAFQASTGHTHDGTANEGGAVTKLLGNTLTFGAGTAGTDITITFDGETSDGVLKWMEDEDYFEFSDDILVASTEKLQFRDTAIYINSSADGQLDLVADTEIQIAATTIDMNGNADISGNLGIGGNLTVTGTTTFNGGTMTLGDAATDNVVFGADVDSNIIPDDDNTYDLGSSSQEWKDIYIDGVAYLDAIDFNGTSITSTGAEINILDGDTSATSTTVADADRVVLNDGGTMKQVAVTDLSAYFDDEITAMPNLVTTAATTVGALNSGSITSGFGTIDTGSSTITTTGLITGGSLDIDDVVINGTTIGHTDDTDLMTVASGLVTVAGEISVTTLDIGGTDVTSTATELNIMDGNTSATSTTLADADRVVVNDAGTMKQVALTDFETYFESALDTLSNVTTVGALNSGSITSGFGAIDNGSSAITTTGTITGGALTVDDVGVNGKVITLTGSSGDTATITAGTNGALDIATTDAGGAAGNIQITADGTAELAGTTVTLDSSGGITLDADGGTITFADGGSSLGTITSSGYSGTAAVATTVTITDNENTNENNSIIFTAGGDTDGGNLGLESDGDLTYNPSTGTLTVPNVSVSGTFTTVDSVTMNANNAVVFEGSSADAHETTLTSINATGDRTISLPNVSGTLPVLAAVSTTQITSTPEELNKLDGVTATTTELNIVDGDTSVGTTAVAGGDGIVTNDNGTMRHTSLDTFDTYLAQTTKTLTNKTLTTPTITTPVVNTGLQLKNGSTSAGFIEFFEDSDNGTNKVTVIGPASTDDVTLTLPNATGTIATGADATALAIALG